MSERMGRHNPAMLTSPSESLSTADTPNPFSIALPPAGGAKQRFVHALQFLAIAAAVTAIWLLATVYGKQYLLNQLVQELPTLDATEKSDRLIQIAGFGIEAIQPLSSSLMDDEDAVSEVAFGLLNQLQNDWTTLSPELAARSHQKLIEGIHANLQAKPRAEWTSRQTARSRSLLRQTMLEFAGTETLGDTELDEEVRQLIATVSQGSRETLAQLDQPTMTLAKTPVTTTDVNELPSADTESMWTDWPPSRPVEIIRSGTPNTQAVQVRETATRLQTQPADASQEGSSAQLEPVPDGVTVPLTQVPGSPNGTPAQRASGTPRLARSTDGRVLRVNAELTGSPFTAMDDETILRHLGHPNASLAEQAHAELISRGFTKVQLEFGTAIAVAEPKDRITLIDSMLQSGGLNAWPWLSMLLDDSDRHVRLHVITILAPSKNRTVQQRLHERLKVESDLHVATKIRKVLDLRGN
ncbi:hypothetical protein [Rhodopirellula sp. P2]|uniref:hypothetical protein n=1 Tax=Rhodopirellula sp. P2 TaxID=2127060 RepID=UPI00236810C7|nr:hypothetical protein [Rhodopirellula sp. P2]WDQ15533.1 hypothetical protein PSR62_18040 [Rhodopirellula sp. P2]